MGSMPQRLPLGEPCVLCPGGWGGGWAVEVGWSVLHQASAAGGVRGSGLNAGRLLDCVASSAVSSVVAASH